MKLEDIQNDAIEELQRLMKSAREAAESELHGLVQSPSRVMSLIQQNISSNEFIFFNKQFWQDMLAEWAYSVKPQDLSRIVHKIATDIANRLDIASEAGIIVEFLGPKGKEVVGKIGEHVGKFLSILRELAIKIFKSLEMQHHNYGHRRYYGRRQQGQDKKVFKRALLNPYIIYTFIEQAKTLGERNRKEQPEEQPGG